MLELWIENYRNAYIVEGMDCDAIALLYSPGAKTAHQSAHDALRLVVGDGARRFVHVDIDLYCVSVPMLFSIQSS